jgi:toxin-antitoxin system PIN domain toxin
VGPFLLDANVLIALAWPRHEFHDRVGEWFARQSETGWATCPFTQTAFVRVISNPAFSADALTPQNAVRLLEANLNLPNHQFWPNSMSVPEALKGVGRLRGHQQITDAYLVGTAIHHRGKLATMDRGIAEWGPSGAVELIGR